MFKKRIIYSCTLCLQDLSKSPKNMKKLLPKRKPERKPSEEDFTTRKSNRGAKLSPSRSTGLHGLTCRFPLAGTAALEEDAQILKVIEAYCTSAKTRQTLNSSESKRNIITCTEAVSQFRVHVFFKVCVFRLAKTLSRRTLTSEIPATNNGTIMGRTSLCHISWLLPAVLLTSLRYRWPTP